MRLICGVLHLDGTAATEATLDGMAAAMIAPGLAPAVRRMRDGALGLAVLDFTGRGEGLAEGDGWAVAADARLDDPDASPDGAVLDAFRRHGRDFPDRIDGDFAVALWRRDAGELWLGRDYIGARPLAWTWQPGRWLAFASMPKGLHAADMAPPTVDPVALGVALTQGFFRGSDSGFAEIAYLEAGHSLCVRAQDPSPPRPHRAYRPNPAQVGRWRGTPEQAADRLRELVRRAVVRRLPSSPAVACHLTGGLDSSAITVLAAREARRRSMRVLALSMVTPEALGPPEMDERPLIADVLAQEADLEHAVVHDVPPMPGREEDPDWPGSIVDGHDDRMVAAAARFGAGLVLSGVGGDEGATYNGASIYFRLLREGRLWVLARELVARARTDGVSVPRAIRDRLIAPLVPAFLRRRRGVMHMRHGAGRYLLPAFVERMRDRRMSAVLRKNSPAERVTAFADHHIPSRCAYYGIMAARHGLAVSFPLLDRDVVDFVLSLPTAMFVADGQSRQPFRRAMRGILPERVRVAKHKVGLFDDRFLRYAERRGDLLSTLAAIRAAAVPLVMQMFDLDAIQAGLELLPEPERVQAHVRGAPGALTNGRSHWEPLLAVSFLVAAARLSAKQRS